MNVFSLTSLRSYNNTITKPLSCTRGYNYLVLNRRHQPSLFSKSSWYFRKSPGGQEIRSSRQRIKPRQQANSKPSSSGHNGDMHMVINHGWRIIHARESKSRARLTTTLKRAADWQPLTENSKRQLVKHCKQLLFVSHNCVHCTLLSHGRKSSPDGWVKAMCTFDFSHLLEFVSGFSYFKVAFFSAVMCRVLAPRFLVFPRVMLNG